MSKFIYGIDIGGTNIKIGLFKENGTLVNKWEIKTDNSNNGNNILNDIYLSLKDNDVNLDNIIGYGFGIPGPVINGVVTRCINLGWTDVDIKSEMSVILKNENIFVINDANAAALGEAWQGSAKKYSSSVMITLGTGVGGGIIVNNKILNGSIGFGGEIGHMQIVHENPTQCNCGSYGCLETIASASGIKRNFCEKNNQQNGLSIVKCNEEVTAKTIFDEAKKGDKIALEVVSDVSYNLALAIQILSVTINPDIFLIGGGVANSGDFLLDKIKNDFKKIAFKEINNTLIVNAKLGNDAGIYGAASMVVKND